MPGVYSEARKGVPMEEMDKKMRKKERRAKNASLK